MTNDFALCYGCDRLVTHSPENLTWSDEGGSSACQHTYFLLHTPTQCALAHCADYGQCMIPVHPPNHSEHIVRIAVCHEHHLQVMTLAHP